MQKTHHLILVVLVAMLSLCIGCNGAAQRPSVRADSEMELRFERLAQEQSSYNEDIATMKLFKSSGTKGQIFLIGKYKTGDEDARWTALYIMDKVQLTPTKETLGDWLETEKSNLVRVRLKKMITDEVHLERVGDDRFEITISNTTDGPFVFCARQFFIVVYHQALGGKRTAITWDGSNAKMRSLGPFDTVLLEPGTSYRCSMRVKIDFQHKIDFRPYLKQTGDLIAIVNPLTLGTIDRRFRDFAKAAPLLSRKLESNKIKVP